MESHEQPHGSTYTYTRPPLPHPPMADPHHHQHHIPPPPPPPPPPPGQPSYQPTFGYSSQFQYNPPPTSSSPLPPPPPPYQHQQPPYPPHQQHQQHQWNPPPQLYSDQYPPAVYPPPPPPPHHSYPPHHQYPPHPPPLHSYPRVNQEWGNTNWVHHPGGEYPVQSNEDDWATRAKAWAAAKASTDYLNVQPQSTQYAQTQYHDQLPQPVDTQYAQTQQQTHVSSSYLQFPVTPTHRSPVVHLQESPSISSGPASYVPDGHSSYSVGDSNPAFRHRESLAATETHLQEVPSSYSSVTDKSGAGVQANLLYAPSSFPITSHQDGNYYAQPLPAIARSELTERSFAYRNHSNDHQTDLSDQPLDFASSFNRVHEHQMQSSFPQHNKAAAIGGMDPVTAAAPIHTWGPSHAPETVYPSLPSGSQHDSSTTFLGRVPGPGFQPPVSSVSAPFDLGARPALYSTTAFHGEAYGVSNISDRPKKAAVPNWLREEIIKKKAVIVSSAQEKNNEDIEDEVVENYIERGDQADSKSIDSSRSNEEDDDDEDYVEAARTAAINQEIKRILTEVLLKVTDELFDEIATKVLSEDGVIAEVNHDAITLNQKASSPTTPKASENVPIPVNSMEYETRADTAKSSSNIPGDVLGLGSYESDDDDDEIQTSIKPNSRENSVDRHSSIKRDSEEIHDAGVDAGSQSNTEIEDRYQEHLENVSNKSSPFGAKTNKSAVTSELKNVGSTCSSEEIIGVKGDVTGVGGKIPDDVSGSLIKNKSGERTARKSEIPGKVMNAKNLMTGSLVRETSTKSDKNGVYETELSSTGKDYLKEVESSKFTKYDKDGDNHVKQYGIHPRKEKMDDRNGSRGKMKEEGTSIEKKTRESDLKRKDIKFDSKDDRHETERGKQTRSKEDHDKKKEHRTGGKEDALKHKPQSSSSKHKRRRSPAVESNGRHSKDSSIVGHVDSTSDDASEDSRRKLHSKRRNMSPSPVKSRKRQVLRSPHSKHSQHRHSPYSSLETTRKRSSRSRLPRRRR